MNYSSCPTNQFVLAPRKVYSEQSNLQKRSGEYELENCQLLFYEQKLQAGGLSTNLAPPSLLLITTINYATEQIARKCKYFEDDKGYPSTLSYCEFEIVGLGFDVLSFDDHNRNVLKQRIGQVKNFIRHSGSKWEAFLRLLLDKSAPIRVYFYWANPIFKFRFKIVWQITLRCTVQPHPKRPCPKFWCSSLFISSTVHSTTTVEGIQAEPHFQVKTYLVTSASDCG